MTDWRSRLVRYSFDETWLDARREGVGGSDAATILVPSSSRGRVDVWRSKVGLDDGDRDDVPIYMRWGHLLEHPVADRFEELTGARVERFDRAIVTHATVPWLRYSPDGVAGEDALYEGKSTAPLRASDWNDGVPPRVFVQVQHGMEVMDVSTCFVACFAGTHRDIIWTEVKRDRDWYYAEAYPKLMEFWDHVESETIPDPVTARDGDAIVDMAPRPTKGESVGLEAFYDDLLDRYEDANARIKEAETEKSVIKGWVAKALGTAEEGELLSGRSWTFKEQARKEVVIPASRFRVLRTKCFVLRKRGSDGKHAGATDG